MVRGAPFLPRLILGENDHLLGIIDGDYGGVESTKGEIYRLSSNQNRSVRAEERVFRPNISPIAREAPLFVALNKTASDVVIVVKDIRIDQSIIRDVGCRKGMTQIRHHLYAIQRIVHNSV